MDDDDLTDDLRILAADLRTIAKAVCQWDKRDLLEAQARGDSSLNRTCYDLDLQRVAQMLEGTHPTHQLKLMRKRGRPAGLTVEREMEIVRFIAEVRDRPGGNVAKGQRAAMKEFNISEGAAKAAWRNLRIALEPGNEKIVPFFEKLRRKGMVTIKRLPARKRSEK